MSGAKSTIRAGEGAPPLAPRPGRIRQLVSLLGTRPDYRRLALALIISRIGTGVSTVALPVAALRLSGGQSIPLGVTLALFYGPQMLFGPLAGPIVDRGNRVRVMLAADVARALLIASAMLADQLAHLYAISFALGIGTAFFLPAFQSVLPETVSERELMDANALLYSSRSVVDIGAPALGAGIIALAGLDAAFALDAATYVISALFVLGLARSGVGAAAASPAPAGSRIRQFAHDLVEGIRYHRRAPVVRDLLLLLAVTALSAGGLNLLLVLITSRHFGRPEEAVGLISTCMAVGITLGNLLIAYIGQRVPRPYLFAAGYWLSGGAALLVLGASSFAVGLALFLLAGFANAAFHAPPDAWVQEVTDPAFRGRVFALRNVTMSFGFVVSTLLTGVITAAAGLQVTWAGLAALMMAGGVLALALPSLRAACRETSAAATPGTPGTPGTADPAQSAD